MEITKFYRGNDILKYIEYLFTLLNNKVIMKKIYFVAGILILLLLFRSVYSNFNEVNLYLRNINYLYLILSIFSSIIFLVYQCFIWNIVLRKLKVSINGLKLLNIYAISIMARYLPGGMWNIVSRAHLLKLEGISTKIAGLSLIYEIIFLLFSGILFAFLVVIQFQLLPIGWALFFLIIILTILLKFSFITSLVKKVALKKMSFNNFGNNITLKDTLILIVNYLVVWVLSGIGIYFLVMSFLGVHVSFLLLASIFSFSWIVGFLSPIPGGLGVRETSLAMLLAYVLDSPDAYAISLIMRLVSTISEILLFCIVKCLIFFRNYKSNYGENMPEN
ncbi:lysylphosphatidylglycerol synthase transmembrane domain-containing protein [Paenibacillus naphthalenovorans]|uniref:lysylphosphatidylglycerol synthase transmembrane domain-containing protein n=1 Tax=Paenibacillus naphthalenovorans TaxID=162209 RepID=UPI003D295D04